MRVINPHTQLYVFLPISVLVGEALITGWRNSSLRVLATRGRSIDGDWLYWFFHVSKLNDLFVAWATVGVFAYAVGRGYTLHALSGMPAVAQFIVAFVVVDFFAYWTHRALHVVPVLWEFHKVHHSATELNAMMTFRFHPLEKLVWHIEAFAVFLLLGGDVVTFAAFTLFDTLLGQVQHARVRWNYGPIGALVISPTFHRLHHSTDPADYNRNLGGRLAIWDRLFGTYSARDIQFDAIGTGETLTVAAEFCDPFRHLLASIRRGRLLLRRQTYRSRSPSLPEPDQAQRTET